MEGCETATARTRWSSYFEFNTRLGRLEPIASPAPRAQHERGRFHRRGVRACPCGMKRRSCVDWRAEPADHGEAAGCRRRPVPVDPRTTALLAPELSLLRRQHRLAPGRRAVDVPAPR